MAIPCSFGRSLIYTEQNVVRAVFSYDRPLDITYGWAGDSDYTIHSLGCDDSDSRSATPVAERRWWILSS